MKNKILNSLVALVAIVTSILAIAGASLGCMHALILLVVPVAATSYMIAKIVGKTKAQKKLNLQK